MGDKRDFKGIWFPAEVWLDERLTALEKMILMEIDSLDGDDGCYASNEYLGGFCQCSQSKVSAAISKLKALGYIRVKSFDGRRRILESCLTFSKSQPSKIKKSDQQNLEQRILEKNTSNNTSKEDIPFLEIVTYLNEKTGRRYRNVESTKRLIRARWAEGYRLDDFRRVIDVKASEWKGTKFERYLQPSTLFAPSHFDEYLNMSTGESARYDEYAGTRVTVIDNREQAYEEEDECPF